MANLNKLQIIGRLGSDPELRTISSGDDVASFNVACTESYKDKNGEKNENTMWVKVQVWGKRAKPCAEILKKGHLCYAEGRLKIHTNEKNGKTYVNVELNASDIQFLTPKNEGQDNSYSVGEMPKAQPSEPETPKQHLSLDDMPF